MNQIANDVVKSIRLLCQEGSADKEYVVKIVRCGDDAYHLKGYNGRRGSALKEQPKTKEPLSLEAVTKAYDKLVKSKLSDRYVVDTGNTSDFQYLDNPLPSVPGHSPSLPVAVTLEEALRLIADPAWGAQEKMDGERGQAATKGAAVIGSNRKAVEVPLPMGVVDSLLAGRGDAGDIHVDGERIGERLYVFDLLAYGEYGNIKQWPFEKRSMLLAEAIEFMGDSIVLVPVAVTTAEKQALFDRVKAANGEGLVFKRLDGQYIDGKVSTNSNIVKFKFYEEATAKVTSIHPTKQSVGIAVIGADGGDHPVGNLTIPPNAVFPAIGDFVDVRYLYLYDGGSLFQPSYSKPRHDKDAADTLLSLKLKPEAPL